MGHLELAEIASQDSLARRGLACVLRAYEVRTR